MKKYWIGYMSILIGIITLVLVALFGKTTAHFAIIVPIGVIMLLFGFMYIGIKWTDVE